MITAEEKLDSIEIWDGVFVHTYNAKQAMIEFAKLHVEKIKALQMAKYYAGETGYIKNEEWQEIITNIK